MRLAAIFIPSNSLPFIFGSEHTSQVINFGGKYYYQFREDESRVILSSYEPNPDFVAGFWGENLLLVSAIVGKNGTGKTSILRAMSDPDDENSKPLAYVYEYIEGDAILIENKTGLEFSSEIDLTCTTSAVSPSTRLYYSPVLDYDLKSTRSPIALVRHFDKGLEEYYVDSVDRSVMFMQDPVASQIKQVYPDFPIFEKLKISVKNHSKSDFRKIYIDANFANPIKVDSLINEIDKRIRNLREDLANGEEIEITGHELLGIYEDILRHLKAGSFTELFEMIWRIEEYPSGLDGKIHDGESFLKNLEITILSYLQLGSVFAQMGLGSTFDFQDVLASQTFEARLDKFLEVYLISQDDVMYQSFKNRFGDISIEKHDQMIGVIESNPFSQVAGGVNYTSLKKKLKRDLDAFLHLRDFYDFIKSKIHDGVFVTSGGGFGIDISGHAAVFHTLVEKYRALKSKFDFLPTEYSLLEFSPDRLLSTGEKSLIEFYASVHHYVTKYKDAKHMQYERYLLLLDEASLGFHPEWKRKFIDAISKTLPLVFQAIRPYKMDPDTKKYHKSELTVPQIQVVFTTHDPLTLSDIPNGNVTYLDKKEGLTKLMPLTEENRPDKTFGANISDLFKGSFFLDKALIGDFARHKIDSLFSSLNQLLKQERRVDSALSNEMRESMERSIAIVDEPLVREKLYEMFDAIFNQPTDYEISRLERRLENLKSRRKK